MAAAAAADAIVVAAGASTRMDGVDKLLATIGDRPLLAHTIGALRGAEAIGGIVVVTSHERRDALAAGGWAPPDRVTFVEGGQRRQDSVRAGFDALESSAPDPDGGRIVLVHDGARPAVSRRVIDDVIAATARHGAAIPALAVGETLKRVSGDLVETTVDRADLVAAQTPQGVRRGLLREALASSVARDGIWTDEAALLEACRIAVHVVPGDPANLKVTLPGDLARVEAILGAAAPARVGIGQDLHPFGPDAPLALGGVTIDGAPRLSGHSDGDVVLHAVADAILGAAGLGDLGRLFPAGPSTPAGIDSSHLLSDVVSRIVAGGLAVVGLDVTIVAARPRLGDVLPAMGARLAELVGTEPTAVNVKASTGNLAGFEGAGRGISAIAIVTLVPHTPAGHR